MSSLGPIQYEQDQSSPFLGRDYIKNASFSSKVGHEIDIEIRQIISDSYKKAFDTINDNLLLLELIKDTLLEKETIVYEEIQQLAQTLSPLPTKVATDENKAVKPAEILEELLKVEPEDDEESEEKSDKQSNSQSEKKSSKKCDCTFDHNDDEYYDHEDK